MSYLYSRVLVGVVLFALLTVLIVSNAVAMPVVQQEAEGQAYAVQRGDSLYAISERLLGNGALWPSIQEATNAKAAMDDTFASIENPRLIYAGQMLWIPAATGEAAEMAEAMAAGESDEADAGDTEMTADEEMASAEDEATDNGDGEMMMSDAAQESLTGALDQLSVAITHAGLLQSSLEAGDLDGAQTHAEHVINIVDGENGDEFGDGNRDGNTQNPGDGVGVRVYLANGGAEMESQVAEAIETAGKLFAVDTVDEASQVATELSASLTALEDAATAALASGGVSSDEQEMDATEDDASMTTETVDMDDALSGAQGQAELAMVHYGFFLDELGAGNLAGAQGHVEHFINILDGEGGSHYGDNNRDGQTQNPGDGVGVRGHLEAATVQLEDGELKDAVEEILVLVDDGSSEAIQIFGTDSTEDAQPIGEAIGEILAELQAAVAALEGMASNSASE